MFHHNRLADEPTGIIESLYLWSLGNVASKCQNEKTTTISRTNGTIKFLLIMWLYYTDV